MLAALPIPAKESPNRDGCCTPCELDICGALIRFGMDVRLSDPELSPPNKSPKPELLFPFVAVLELLLEMPKRSTSAEAPCGDGGAGIAESVLNRF